VKKVEIDQGFEGKKVNGFRSGRVLKVNPKGSEGENEVFALG
jgi:hypothetical protein